MAIPELYRFGREGTWYGLRLFSIYMLDAIYQVRLFIHQIDAMLIFVCPFISLLSSTFS